MLLASLHLVIHQNPRVDCEIHTYFSLEEKKPVHLLKLNPFPIDGQETEIESTVVTLKIFSFSKSLECFLCFIRLLLVFLLLVHV